MCTSRHSRGVVAAKRWFPLLGFGLYSSLGLHLCAKVVSLTYICKVFPAKMQLYLRKRLHVAML